MSKRPTVLMILDGYGLNPRQDHNAVALAQTPVMDRLMKECPFVQGQASGLYVGLPDGQMGNSEVGHLNMGAGRIVYQDLTRITKAIQDGDFFENEVLVKAMENVKKNGSQLHMYGAYTATIRMCMPCWRWQRDTDLTRCLSMRSLTGVTPRPRAVRITRRNCRTRWMRSVSASSA